MGCVCVWVGKEGGVDKESFLREGKYFVKMVIYFYKYWVKYNNLEDSIWVLLPILNQWGYEIYNFV